LLSRKGRDTALEWKVSHGAGKERRQLLGLRTPNISWKFSHGACNPDATIKTRDFSYSPSSFVPLTFKPDRDEYLREIEDVNGLDKGFLVRARWIKTGSKEGT